MDFETLPGGVARQTSRREPKLSLYNKEISELCQFSRASGFTLAETFLFFLGERLFGYPAISDRTRSLYDDLEEKKLLRENSMDRMDRKIYIISVELLEMLVMMSLQEDLCLVVSEILRVSKD